MADTGWPTAVEDLRVGEHRVMSAVDGDWHDIIEIQPLPNRDGYAAYFKIDTEVHSVAYPNGAKINTRPVEPPLPKPGLTEFQSMVIEVLIARARLGETCWTFSRRTQTTKALQALEDLGLISFDGDPTGNWRASFTVLGERTYLAKPYWGPTERAFRQQLMEYRRNIPEPAWDSGTSCWSRSMANVQLDLQHFHGGPFAGEHLDTAQMPDDAVRRGRWLINDARAQGCYLRDQGSAGGRCWDWQDAE